MRVGVNGFGESEVAAIKQLLYPYDLEIGDVDSSDLIISRDPSFECSEPVIRAKPNHEPNLPQSGAVNIDLNLITNCVDRLRAVLNPKIAFRYKLATRLPLHYNVIPASVRSALLKTRSIDSSLFGHLSNENGRRLLTRAFTSLGFDLQRKSPPALLITHDVDTPKGIRRALVLKKIERDLGVQSIWFLSSGDYSIPKNIARELAVESIIGSHDVKHDGKLIHIRKQDELVRRLRQSRTELERVFDTEVTCFRSPLLQFSTKIMSALEEAEYRFDFSLPCWEPVYPITMSGFGVESVSKMEIDGIIETPLSLFQDHQLLYVLGMSPREAARYWIEQAKIVRSYDGDIVLLVHPDYSFANEPEVYRRLVESLMELHANPRLDRNTNPTTHCSSVAPSANQG